MAVPPASADGHANNSRLDGAIPSRARGFRTVVGGTNCAPGCRPVPRTRGASTRGKKQRSFPRSDTRVHTVGPPPARHECSSYDERTGFGVGEHRREGLLDSEPCQTTGCQAGTLNDHSRWNGADRNGCKESGRILWLVSVCLTILRVSGAAMRRPLHARFRPWLARRRAVYVP